MNKVANYDTLDYDYSTYWKKREYEHQSEQLVLKKLFKNIKNSKWFIDIGGSYGRLLPSYYDIYSNPIIVDYSLKTLQKNYEHIRKDFPRVELIAANAYFLPFKSNTFNGGLMVRVLHHVDRPLEYFKEIYRVMSPNGIYIQEFANKAHIKAVLRALFKLDFSVFNKEPYQQPKKGNDEGAKRGAYVPFLNYHTSWIQEKLKDLGFKIGRKYGCSFLRLNIFKKLFKTRTLLFFEKIFQTAFSWVNISPSIFIKSIAEKEITEKEYSELNQILACPKCKGNLEISSTKAICTHCKKEFNKNENIWDFRI
ncbi:hypothetical protein A3K02_02630 [candidate division WS6 bacterium RIFOXYD1_FULL_33_8]|nr:MAG: hypothetical protein A2369_02230 [candidate division WS6 bacterium RIFOXYB1_FULL_33_15]OGC37420.1 MAG: hypothetical protein A2436_02815 [candidate division WS6 bacterium RIFOXYC1_FULL_33_9]OGC43171.1 MAG: hypothetical protein A3K02_02630 [candidate division WS6 bacterium RIFOXYD1_FULL_33_8]